MHACDSCKLRKLNLFQEFSQEDLEFMREFRAGSVHIPARHSLFHEGDDTDSFFTALSGQGARFWHLENGQRQLINFVFPGDLVGLQAVLTDKAAFTVTAATDMVFCRFPKSRMADLFRANPSRAYDLTWLAAVENHFLGETITTLGQRTGIQRVAWALMRLHARLTAGGEKDGNAAYFPFRQRDLADALGLSLVHTNKTLARLRDYVLWENERLEILDADALARIALVAPAPPMGRPLL